MKHKGKIYGLVGVIGSGKSYWMDHLLDYNESENIPVITGDFSEGIRDFFIQLIAGPNSGLKIDTNSEDYANWKLQKEYYKIPSTTMKFLQATGRQILERIGEGIKSIAGEDVWARYTANKAMKAWSNLPDMADEVELLFGSVRFNCEAESLIKLGRALNKEVVFIFCNYKSYRYEIRDHKSEHFAQWFLKRGCVHQENITQLVHDKINGKIH